MEDGWTASAAIAEWVVAGVAVLTLAVSLWMYFAQKKRTTWSPIRWTTSGDLHKIDNLTAAPVEVMSYEVDPPNARSLIEFTQGEPPFEVPAGGTLALQVRQRYTLSPKSITVTSKPHGRRRAETRQFFIP